MVACNLLQPSLVEKVGARIAHLRNDKPLAFEHGCRHSASHTLAPAVVLGSSYYFEVGLYDGIPQGLTVCLVGTESLERIDGHLRGDFSRGMSAHSICYGEEGRRYKQTVFVILAYLPYVGSASEAR